MKKTFAAVCAAALLGLTGCGSPCQDLGDRICDCQPSGTLRDNCKAGVKNQISSGAEQPTEEDQARCQALLETCVDRAEPWREVCNFIQTPEGKVACGLSY